MRIASHRIIICFVRIDCGFNERAIWQRRREMKNDFHCTKCHRNQIHIFILYIRTPLLPLAHLLSTANWIQMKTIWNSKLFILWTSFSEIFNFNLATNERTQFSEQYYCSAWMFIPIFSLHRNFSVRNSCNLYIDNTVCMRWWKGNIRQNTVQKWNTIFNSETKGKQNAMYSQQKWTEREKKEPK